MAERNQGVRDFLTLYKGLLIELPLAGTKAVLGVAKHHEVEKAAWKSYDTWISLIGRSTDALYRSPFFGGTVGRSVFGFLRVQRLTNAVGEAAFATLRSVTGLAGASEVQAMRTELRGIHSELRSLIAALRGAPVLPAGIGAELDEAAKEDVIDALDRDGWTQAARPDKGEPRAA